MGSKVKQDKVSEGNTKLLKMGFYIWTPRGESGRGGGGGGGGMNWETGIDIYTLICIKWITNKNLLYKKIKFKNSKRNGVLLYF